MEIENLNLQKQIDELKEWKDNWLDTVYPIGSIYISINSTNPEDIFGGAWMPWGSGRVPVGVNTGDSSFNTVEKTGGNKSSSHTHTTAGHVLTVNEMPSHTHTLPQRYLMWDAGSEYEVMNGDNTWSGNIQYGSRNSTYYTPGSTGGGQPHNHGNTGSATVNNLQPYITCYMWKRVEPVFLLEWTDSDGEHSEEVVPDYNNYSYGLNTKIEEIEDSRSGDIINLKLSSYGIKIKSANGLCDTYHTNNIDVSGLDVSEVTNMTQTFSHALTVVIDDLKTINVSGWKTKNVETMNGMFSGRNALTSLDLSSFDTSNVTNMSSMFYDCDRLTYLDISGFDFKNVTNSNNMFNGVPANCLIYVKDQTAKNFVLGVRSDLTNVQIKS